MRWPVFYSLVVSAKYNRIGDGYDATRRADSSIMQALADYLNLQKHGRYLDIGCGTGNYTCALAAQGGAWTGLDPSARMLEAARAKFDNIVWHLGAAENLPFEDAGFDGAICTLAVHHFTDISRGFAEIARVLKPGARLVIVTVTPTQTQAYWLNRYFPKMLQADRKNLLTLAALEAAATAGGLELIGTFPYFITEATQDFFFTAANSDIRFICRRRCVKACRVFACWHIRMSWLGGWRSLKPISHRARLPSILPTAKTKLAIIVFSLPKNRQKGKSQI